MGGNTGPWPAVPPSRSSAGLTRKELRQRRAAQDHGWLRTRWYLLGVGGIAAVLIAVGVALTVNRGGKSNVVKAPSATTVPPLAAATCPLTGTPAPGGVVPQRPALAIKIGNYSGDRPSAGLNQADIVFEEPVEGAYTRLVAVYQCQAASLVGDLRSAREPDVGILSQLLYPIFVHAGGITPILNMLASAPLTDENILNGDKESAVIIEPDRVAPYSTFTNTSASWALDPSDTRPPAPIFSYSASPPAGSVAGSGVSVHIPFSSSSDVTWTWSPASDAYLRSYSDEPDILVDGSQTAATNVVAMTVQTFTGPWVENSEGAQEVEVTATGSGPLVVMRDGAAIYGTWHRSSLTQPATFTTTKGTPITLAPGNTWEELVPQGIPVTVTAAQGSATPTAASR